MSSSAPVGSAAAGGVEDWAAPPLLGVSHPEVFPLPRVQVPPPGSRGQKGIASSRRARWRAREINGALDALNWFAGCREPPVFFLPNVDQLGAQSRVAASVDFAWDGFNAHPTPAAAFKELLRGRSVYDLSAAGVNVAPFTKLADLSLPSSLEGAPELAAVLPAGEHHFLSDGLERMLRAPSEFNAREEAPPCFWDVRLRTSRALWLRVVKHLMDVGLVRALPAGVARERCGLFFVRKKNGSLRIIIDARRANARFAAAPGVELCSSEGWLAWRWRSVRRGPRQGHV